MKKMIFDIGDRSGVETRLHRAEVIGSLKDVVVFKCSLPVYTNDVMFGAALLIRYLISRKTLTFMENKVGAIGHSL